MHRIDMIRVEKGQSKEAIQDELGRDLWIPSELEMQVHLLCGSGAPVPSRRIEVRYLRSDFWNILSDFSVAASAAFAAAFASAAACWAAAAADRASCAALADSERAAAVSDFNAATSRCNVLTLAFRSSTSPEDAQAPTAKVLANSTAGRTLP
jgi:hypothetical protein